MLTFHASFMKLNQYENDLQETTAVRSDFEKHQRQPTLNVKVQAFHVWAINVIRPNESFLCNFLK